MAISISSPGNAIWKTSGATMATVPFRPSTGWTNKPIMATRERWPSTITTTMAITTSCGPTMTSTKSGSKPASDREPLWEPTNPRTPRALPCPWPESTEPLVATSTTTGILTSFWPMTRGRAFCLSIPRLPAVRPYNSNWTTEGSTSMEMPKEPPSSILTGMGTSTSTSTSTPAKTSSGSTTSILPSATSTWW